MNSIIKQNIYEMITDRKYTNIKFTENEYFENNFEVLLYCNDENNKKSIILYNNIKIGKKDIMKLEEKIVKTDYKHIIIIFFNDITTQAKKNIKNINIYVETFSHKCFLLNITKHILQPLKFELFNNEEEIKNLLSSLHLTKKKLCKININDPIARYYDAKTENIFKFERKRGGIYFRIVV